MLRWKMNRLIRSGARPRYAFHSCRRAFSFHFGTTEYAACFNNLPTPDPARLRENALYYLDSFSPQLWYDSPVSVCSAYTKGRI